MSNTLSPIGSTSSLRFFEESGSDDEIDFVQHNAELFQQERLGMLNNKSNEEHSLPTMSSSSTTTSATTDNIPRQNQYCADDHGVPHNRNQQQQQQQQQQHLHNTPPPTHNNSNTAAHISKDDDALLQLKPTKSTLPYRDDHHPTMSRYHNKYPHRTRHQREGQNMKANTKSDDMKAQVNQDSLKLIVLAFFFTTLYIITIGALRYIYLNDNDQNASYGYYRHYLVLSLFIFALPPFTNHAMGKTKNATHFKGFQPFSGGRSFVLLQAGAWTGYGLAALGVVCVLYYGVKNIAKTHSPIIFTTIIALVFISQIFVILSINYFQADAKRREFCGAIATHAPIFKPKQRGDLYPMFQHAQKQDNAPPLQINDDLIIPPCQPCEEVDTTTSPPPQQQPITPRANAPLNVIIPTLLQHNKTQFDQQAAEDVNFDLDEEIDNTPMPLHFHNDDLYGDFLNSPTGNQQDDGHFPGLSYTHSIRSFSRRNGKSGLHTTKASDLRSLAGFPTQAEQQSIVFDVDTASQAKNSVDEDFILPQASPLSLGHKQTDLEPPPPPPQQQQHHKQQQQQQPVDIRQSVADVDQEVQRKLLNDLFSQNNATILPPKVSSPFLQRLIDVVVIGTLYHSPIFGGLIIAAPFLSAIFFGMISVVTLLIVAFQTYYYSTFLHDLHLTGDMTSKFMYDPNRNPLYAACGRYFDAKFFTCSPNEMIKARVHSKHSLQIIYNLDRFITTQEAPAASLDHSEVYETTSPGAAPNPDDEQNATNSPTSGEGLLLESLDTDHYNHTTLGHNVPYLYYLIGRDRYNEIMKRVANAGDGPVPHFLESELVFTHPDLHIKNTNLKLNRLPPISLIKLLNKTARDEEDATNEDEPQPPQQPTADVIFVPTMSCSFQYLSGPHGIYPLSAVWLTRLPPFTTLMGNRLHYEHQRTENLKTFLKEHSHRYTNAELEAYINDHTSDHYYEDVDLDRTFLWKEDFLGTRHPMYNRWEAVVLRKVDHLGQKIKQPPGDDNLASVYKFELSSERNAQEHNSNSTTTTTTTNPKEHIAIMNEKLDVNNKQQLREYQNHFTPLLLRQTDLKLPQHLKQRYKRIQQAGFESALRYNTEHKGNNVDQEELLKLRDTNTNGTCTSTDTDILGASVLSFSPCMRELFLTMGGGDVSKNSYLYRILQNRSNLIIIGGQKEMIYSQYHDRDFYLYTHHFGVIKLSLQAGTAMVPVLVFGENQLLHSFSAPALQGFIYKHFRVWIPGLPHGALYTSLPNSIPLTIILGEPIFPPVIANPADIDDDIVMYYHSLFYTHLANLFFKYRALAGFPDSKLIYF